jgi:hypothetical protein
MALEADELVNVAEFHASLDRASELWAEVPATPNSVPSADWAGPRPHVDKYPYFLDALDRICDTARPTPIVDLDPAPPRSPLPKPPGILAQVQTHLLNGKRGKS